MYYDHLLAITDGGDWQGWIEFFIEAVVSQAESNLAKVRAIRDLYDDCRHRFVEITRSQFAGNAVDAFFERPIIRATDFRALAGFNSRITANNVLRQLEAAGMIRRVREGAGPNPAVYALPQLINIAEGRTVFN